MMYNVADLIGKTIVASKTTDLKRWDSDTAPTVFTVKAGQTLGVLYSWTQNNGNVWFMYYDKNGKPYYSKVAGNIDADAVKQQGVKTTEQLAKEAEDKKKKEEEGNFGYYFEKYAPKAALLIAGVILLPKLINQIKTK